MRVVLILALLLCFANGLSAQQITAETKSGYSSEVEFLDIVDDSLAGVRMVACVTVPDTRTMCGHTTL